MTVTGLAAIGNGDYSVRTNLRLWHSSNHAAAGIALYVRGAQCIRVLR